MKIQVLSDIHLEFSEHKFDVKNTDSDILVLAGDIGVGNSALPFIDKLLQEHQKPIIYILGNHEGYSTDIGEVKDVWRRINQEFPLLHFLDDDVVEIDGVNFIGGTLWTDMKRNNPQAKEYIQRSMNDFKVISYKGKIFEPDDAYDFHEKTLEFFKKSIVLDKPNVIVSHHAPSQRSVSSRYRGSILNSGFVSDLDEEFYNGKFQNVPLWIHGHCHQSFDYQINNTRVVCNPRGYYKQELNPQFRSDFVVELKSST